jgi:hypothetical protein
MWYQKQVKTPNQYNPRYICTREKGNDIPHEPDPRSGTPNPSGLHLNNEVPFLFFLQINASLMPTTNPVMPAKAINASKG